jgi:AcrR family transcriptional regulator
MPRKTRLDRAAVVAAAASLIQAEGLGALSINRLARELGIQPPSLYNHIDGLPGLYRELALLNARQMGDQLANAAIGKSGPAALEAVAQAYRDYIKTNPALYQAGLRPMNTGIRADAELEMAEDRIVQVALAVVASFGLHGDDALHAVRGLRSLVHGFATLEVAGGFGLPLEIDESFRRLVVVFTDGLQDVAEGAHTS